MLERSLHCSSSSAMLRICTNSYTHSSSYDCYNYNLPLSFTLDTTASESLTTYIQPAELPLIHASIIKRTVKSDLLQKREYTLAADIAFHGRNSEKERRGVDRRQREIVRNRYGGVSRRFFFHVNGRTRKGNKISQEENITERPTYPPFKRIRKTKKQRGKKKDSQRGTLQNNPLIPLWKKRREGEEKNRIQNLKKWI